MKAASVLRSTALVATVLMWAPFAFAGPSVASPEMKAALAKAQQGPTELRRYVERTKPIYQLDYVEVMTVHEQQAAAAKSHSPSIAQAN